MKVVLCTSPHVRHPAVLQADFAGRPGLMYSFVPLGLLSLAAVIRESGHYEPFLFDLNSAINNRLAHPLGDLYRSLAQLICAVEPEVVGFMTECDSYHHILQVCAQLRELMPNVAIMLGGPHASSTAVATIERWKCVDAVCVGEGERTILPLVKSLMSTRREKVPGAIIRGPNEAILNGGLARLVDDLDSLPMPAFDMYQPNAGEEIFLEVGRGCPFACTFCSTAPYWERRHRVKSPERIVAEIKYVQSLYGPRRFHFTHDLFTTDRRWAWAVSDAIASLDPIPSWTCSARADRVDSELLRQMARGGCNAIYYGVESGSSRVLSAIKKDIPWSVTQEAINNSIAIGIQPNAGLIIGFPEDNKDSVADTFSTYTRLLKQGAKPVHIFGFCPFNGAASFNAVDQSGAQKHFLDIPLPVLVDKANRQLVVNDPLLFSAYRRLAADSVKSLAPGFIEGIDEFTPLVESCLLPTLILVEHSVSMLDIYKSWLAWISAHNDNLQRSPYRRFYGSPLQYAKFLSHLVQQIEGVRPDLFSYLDLLQRSFAVAASFNLVPVSMASYRSGMVSPEFLRSRVEEGCSVVTDNVLDAFSCAWDLGDLLKWAPMQNMPTPRHYNCGYVLQRTERQGIRLLQVAPEVADLLQVLQGEPLDAVTLWAGRVHDTGPLTAMGVDGVIQAMVLAGSAGLLRIQEET